MQLLCLLLGTPPGVVSCLLSGVTHDTQPFLVTLTLPANTNFEYKYIRKQNGVVTWEPDPNNSNTTPAGGSYVINDKWR